MDLELERLKRDQETASADKAELAQAGAIADNLANRQSFGNFFLGRMNPHQDVSSTFKAKSAAIEDPLERKKKLLDMVKASREEKRDVNLDSPESPETKAVYDSFSQAGIKLPPGKTANQLIAAYGKPAEYAMAKFKEGQERETKLAVAGAKVPKGMIAQVDPLTGEKTLVRQEGNYKQNQYKAGGFAKRAVDADSAYKSLLGGKFDPASAEVGAQQASLHVPFVGNVGVPERWKDQNVKKMEQAQLDFITAVLRPESGASIRPEEFEAEARKYFPQAGDSKEVQAAKADARKNAVAALVAEAGGAYDEVGSAHHKLWGQGEQQQTTPDEARAELQRRKAMKAQAGQ